MSAVFRHLFFYFSSLFFAVPMALLPCTEPHRVFVLLSEPVTCFLSFSLSLFLYHTSSYFSSQADNWSPGGHTRVCFREGCMKGSGEWGGGLAEEISASQCLSFCFPLINFVCLISGVFFSAPILWCEKRCCSTSQEASLDKRHCALHRCVLTCTFISRDDKVLSLCSGFFVLQHWKHCECYLE